MIRAFYVEFRAVIAISVSLIGLGAALLGVNATELRSLVEILSPAHLLLAMLLLSASMFVTFARFYVAARRMGIPLDARSAWSAFVAGQSAGLLPFGVVAQAAGRTALLSAFPGSASKITLLTLAERLLALGSLAVLGGAGLTITIGWSAVDVGDAFWAQVTVWAIATTSSIGVVGLVWRRQLLHAVATIGRALPLGILAWIAGSSLLAHLLTLCAYLAVLASAKNELSLMASSAGIAVVMLAASVPIGVAGWGIREFAAVLVLGAIGVEHSVALATSVSVGILSLLVVGAMSAGGVAVVVAQTKYVNPQPTPIEDGGLDRALATISCLMVASLVPFQAQLSIAGNSLSINAADVFALVGLVLLAATLKRNDVPQPSRILLLAFGIMAGAITTGILIGLLRTGPTTWALMNRGLGLVITASYLCVSLLALRSAGEELLLLLAKALVYAFSVAGVIEIGCEVLVSLRLIQPDQAIAQLLWQGFSASSNTTIVQAALALVLWAGVVLQKDQPVLFRHVPPVALATQLLMSTSRTSAVLLCLVLPVMAFLWPATRRPIAVAFLVGFMFSLLGPTIGQPQSIGGQILRVVQVSSIDLFSRAVSVMKENFGNQNVSPSINVGQSVARSGQAPLDVASVVIAAAVKPASDSERMESIRGGLQLFRDNTLIGGGVGRYMASRLEAGESALVIHSTPVWILAEIGILGAFAFAAAGVFAGSAAWQNRAVPPMQVATLAFAVWTTAGLVHDLINQRMFWLTLGILVAMVPSWRKPAPS